MKIFAQVCAMTLATLMLLLVGCGEDGKPSSPTVSNHPPEITGVAAWPEIIYLRDSTSLVCSSVDSDSDSLRYSWICALGSFVGSVHGSSVVWRATGLWRPPRDTNRVNISVFVSDGTDSTMSWAVVTVFNGDLWNDTGEPFVDVPDSSGNYNGHYDSGEIFYDLPSTLLSDGNRFHTPTTNGVYDGPNDAFDEYELFTYPAESDSVPDPRYPVRYTWEDIRDPHGIQHGGSEWRNLPQLPSGDPGYLAFIPEKSTWQDRNGDGVFHLPE